MDVAWVSLGLMVLKDDAPENSRYLARPSAGTVRIAGYDAVKEAEKVRPARRVESSNLPIRLSDSVRKLAILRTYVWT